MEKESLAELAALITEEIYLVPEPIVQAEKNDDMEVQEPQPLMVKGEFAQQILILHEEDELSQAGIELLSKILSAVNHSMRDVGLISSAELRGRDLDDLKEIGAHTIIRFGRIDHPINAMPIEDYQVHSEEEVDYLFADSISQISEDNNLKRNLWNALRILFHVTK